VLDWNVVIIYIQVSDPFLFLLSATDSVGLFCCTEMMDLVYELLILIHCLHPVFEEGQIK